MTHPSQNPTAAAGRGLRKLLALLGAGAFVAVTLAVSRTPSLPTAEVAAADGPRDDKPATPAARAAAAATAFLDALDASQRPKAALEFGDPKKSTWSNLPVSFVQRNGVRLGDLTPAQRDKAMAVVAAVLSKDGYRKVVDIMAGDQKLVEEGKGGGPKAKGPKGGGKGPGGAMFGADQYYLAIFGTPSETKPWMVQFGGHHLGVNVTVAGKQFVLAPTHTGAQPAAFQRDGKEVRPLGPEADAAFKLLTALDTNQRAQAVIGDRPQQELLLGPGRDGRKVEPKGVKGSALTAAQQALMLDVIRAWIGIGEPDAAAARMAAIGEKVGDTYFAWSGPTDKPGASYFRVQGPTVAVEFAPQGGAGHVHTVIRDPEDDYGAKSATR